VANSEVAALGFLARNGNGGGDSVHGGSIPSARRRRREMRWSWGRVRRRSGRRLAMAEGDGHGGELSPWEEFTGEREQE
jgi:hypothetical protein